MTMDKLIDELLIILKNPGIRFAIIVVGSVLAAAIVKFVVIRSLILFTRKTKSKMDDKVIDAMRGAIFVSVLLVGFWYASVDFGFSENIATVIFSLIKTIAIIIWGRAFLRIGSLLLRFLGENREKVSVIQPATLPLFEISFKVVIVAGVAYLAMVSWGINVTGWLASAGVVGIAVGFAAKDTIANLFAGIFILTDAPYKLGDFIILDNGERGQVTQIGIRSTRILTRDDIEITVPNALIANSKIINETAGPHTMRRVRIKVSVAYGSDVEQVRQILKACVDNTDQVATKPAASIRFIEMGDSGLIFEVRVWAMEPIFKGRIIDQLNTRVYNALNEANIEIPYPKRVVYIKQTSNEDA